MDYKILKLPDVMARTALSRSSIYAFISNGKFPKQLALGERSVGWLEKDIQSWISNRIAASRGEVSHEA